MRALQFCLVLGFAGCLDFGSLGGASQNDVQADAGPSTAADSSNERNVPSADAGACNLDAPFQAPTRVTELDTTAYTAAAKLTADELSVFFARVDTTPDGGGHLQLYAASRASIDVPFDEPTALPFNQPDSDFANPSPTADNLHLYYANNGSLGLGRYDIWVASRSSPAAAYESNAPMNPGNLGAPVDTDAGEGQPAVMADSLVIYFTSNRDGDSNIYRATRVSATQSFTMDDAAVLANVNTPAFEYGPTPSRDDLTMYFESQRTDDGAADAGAQYRIWKSTRTATSEPFGVPTLQNELTIDNGAIYPSWISDDGCRLYFYDLQPNGAQSTVYRAEKPTR